MLTRETILKDMAVAAVAYSYSYKADFLSADQGRNSLICAPFDGAFFDIKSAFDGVLEDVRFDISKLAISDSSNDFRERRAAVLKDSILGYTLLIEDTGKESKGRKVRQCTETIVHAAVGLQN